MSLNLPILLELLHLFGLILSCESSPGQPTGGGCLSPSRACA